MLSPLIGLKKLPHSKAHLEQEIDLRFSMRSALFPLGRHDDLADHVRKAELLAKEINDNARLASCYNYLASHHWIRGRHKESIRLGEEGLHLAGSAGNFSVEITTKFHLGIPLLYTGEIERQVALHREVAQRLSGPSALERHGLSSVPSVTARGFMTWGLSELGEFEEAEMWALQAEALADQVINAFSTAFIQACSGLNYLRKGEFDTALIFLEKANNLVRKADIQSIFSFVAGSLGYTYLLLERREEALPNLEEAVKPQNLDFSLVSAIYPLTTLSEAYRLNGQIAKAFESAEKALHIYRQTEEHYFSAWALFVMSKIQSDNNSEQPDQAKQRYIQAIDLADKLKMRPLLAHCHLEFGQYCTRTGENEKARFELLKAIELYRFLGMKFWQPKAEAILSEVS
jgi:tetratricopeptide (TPR) repeat protein